MDFDPPAYSQPTLPPPPVTSADAPAPGWSARWGSRLVGAGLVALAGLTVGAYALLPHGAPAPAAAGQLTQVPARLGQLIQAFPAELPERACAETDERIPLVLYSAVDGLRNGVPAPQAERELVDGEIAVTGDSVTMSTRRIAVLRTLDLREPQASIGEPMPGRYEARIVVFDASTNTPLCHTTVKVWSSPLVLLPKISARTLHEDFVNRVRGGIAEGASRLNITLDF
jgi:hypothetical protein